MRGRPGAEAGTRPRWAGRLSPGWPSGSLGETVWAGGKLQEREEGLRPEGPQIPPGRGSLDSVGGEGGGRGRGWGEAEEGGLAPGSWPGRPPTGEGAGPGQGPAPGLGPAGHGAGSHSPWRLSLWLSLWSLSFSLTPDPALLSAPPPRHLKGCRAQKLCLGSSLISSSDATPSPHTPGQAPRALGEGHCPNIAPLLPHGRGQGEAEHQGKGGQEGGRGWGAVPQLRSLAEVVEKEAAQRE